MRRRQPFRYAQPSSILLPTNLYNNLVAVNRPARYSLVAPVFLVVAAMGLAGCGSPDNAASPADEAHVPASRDSRRVEHTSGNTVPSHAIPPRFETFQMADGLVSNEANTFLQDRQGFVWIGTFNGLSRFDGLTFRNFLHDPADSTSLGNNVINFLLQDRFGAIWIGTDDGLSRFDPETETFSHTRHNPDDPTSLSHDVVRVVAEGADGAVWLGTRGGGLNHLDPTTRTFTRVGQRAGERSGSGDATWDVVHYLLPNDDGTLWVGGGDGLALYDPVTDTFSAVFRDPDDPTSGSLPTVSCLLRDRTGAIWVGTMRDGVFRLDSTERTLKHYPYSPSTPGGLGDPWVLSLLEDHTGIIWLGSNGGGLHRYDAAADAFIRYTYDASDPQSLRDDDVLALLETRDGVLWVGTYAGLARRYPLSTAIEYTRARPGDARGLRSNTVTSFSEEEDGTLWVGTDGGGLQRRNPEAHSGFSHVAYELEQPNSRAATDILSLARDDTGALWIGAIGGLYRRHPTTGRFARIAPERGASGWPVGYNLHVADGRILAATGSTGMYDIDTATGEIDHVYSGSIIVTAVVRDRSGAVWVGTYREGLWQIVTGPGESPRLIRSPIEPSSAQITTLYVDAKDALWIGTSDGLDRVTVSASDTTVTRFRYADGLPNTSIRGIHEDRDGRLWISTGSGLSWRDEEIGTFVSYDARDGIEAGGPLYRGAYSGRFYVGGELGFITFDPSDVTTEPPPPAPVLTGLQMRGENVPIGADRSRLSRSLSMTDNLRLHFSDRVVTLSFASLDFRASGNLRYAVRLDGFDNDWRDVGSQHEVTFTNLGPGRYTFRVRAAGRDGVWGEETRLSVTVAPPWWRTWLSYAAYLLLFVGLLTVTYRARRRRIELRHQLEIEHIESQNLRELDQAKSQFFANVSHEFRTPLTLTLGPLDDILAGEYGEVSDDVRDQLLLARRSAGRVLSLINQILDVARLEAGQTRLRASTTDLTALVQDVIAPLRAIAEQRLITFQVEVPDEPVSIYADPEKLDKVLINLLSNAFKFTPAGGTIRVSVDETPDAVNIIVRDSGRGIPPEALPRVFDRFYRVSESSMDAEPGTGIGLALTKELVELHGGTITAASDVGFGSTFTVQFPIGRAHLTDADIVEEALRAPGGGTQQLLTTAGLTPSGNAVAPVNAPDQKADEETGEAADNEAGEDELAEVDTTTVLVVEDNADVRAYTRRHLEKHYRVLEARNGREGLEAARAQLPDLILSDVMMPEVDGIELCRELKSDPETDFIPLVLLTAKAEQEDKLDGLHEHADDYLTKPFDVPELLARVKNLIDSRKLLRRRFAEAAPAMAEATPSTGLSAADFVSADAQFLELVQVAIADGMPDEHFGVEQLAAAVGLSRSQLHRKLKLIVEQSPSEIIRTTRLERAAQMLAARAGTVSEIAYGVGFKSVSHFSNAFQQKYGCRPSAYSTVN